jgi:single-strand DNA-binding protein
MLPRVSMEVGVVFDPEVRFSQAGKAWAKVRVVAKDRRNENGTWVDGEALFMDCICFGRVAEHLTESVRKGDTIIVNGRLGENVWEKDGVERRSIQVTADEIGVSLLWGEAKTERAMTDSTASAKTAPQEQDPPW